MNDQEPSQCYYAMALDPIHVGTGGYRLGEVDMTIVREPGTNLPKIPGSSLAGAARAYTAMTTDHYRRDNPEPAAKKKYISCAGKGGEGGDDHCGEIDCPVCVTYGFTIGLQNRSFHGLAQFYDAQVLFFPVHTMVGPVWVTSLETLSNAGLPKDKITPISHQKLRVVSELVSKPDENRRWGLNLGWLFLEIDGDNLEVEAIWEEMKLPAGLERIQKRLVLVPDALFSLVVNSNLEVRTSVSIDPATGAAEDGALFTYEALPRSTVLHFPIVYHNPQHYVFPARVKNEKGEEVTTPTPFSTDKDSSWVKDQVVSGLRLMEHLGVGGMNTRGFGRLRILNLPVAKPKEGDGDV
ncbi:type III-B CRISPR module RAMP protein Cmr4 [Candidatus Bipolaricaulota bacterium]|nr:type III-B CRISPR module RAMP protein Cmr4 [Candidatus Bipolaricaulota bacterium]